MNSSPCPEKDQLRDFASGEVSASETIAGDSPPVTDHRGSDHTDNTIGPYELLGMIGAGGMGTVYRARHRRLNKIVALKTHSAQPQELECRG